MRIAVVHEWLVERAGSEKVLEQILTCFPDADLYCLVDSLGADDRRRLQGKTAQTSFIAKLPFAKRKPWIYLPLLPIAIEQFDLSSYDLVLSNSHAVAKGVVTGPGQLHISYVHSPMRYAWDLQHQYLSGPLGRGLRGLLLRAALHYLRMWDTRTAHGVERFVANSDFIRRRIRKVYRREATVIHPPVDLERFTVREAKDDFYLCASRFVPYKRVDLVAEAFTRMNRRLVIIGDGPDAARIKAFAAPNIAVLGYQPDEVLIDHLQRARALIFAGEEDFGLLPVEAQACGTPVIAFGRGGALETVRSPPAERPTGLFFHEQSIAALTTALDQFEASAHLYLPMNCRANAEQFSHERFRTQFERFVRDAIERWAGGSGDAFQ